MKRSLKLQRAVGIMAIFPMVVLLSACDHDEIGVRQPTIVLEDEQWIEPESGSGNVVEEEQESLKLPTEEELSQGILGEANEVSIAFLQTYLTRNSSTSPDAILSRIDSLISSSLRSQLAEELREYDWEFSRDEAVIAEVQTVEVTEIVQQLPRAAVASVAIFEADSDSFDSDPVEIQSWNLGLSYDGITDTLLIVSASQMN